MRPAAAVLVLLAAQPALAALGPRAKKGTDSPALRRLSSGRAAGLPSVLLSLSGASRLLTEPRSAPGASQRAFDGAPDNGRFVPAGDVDMFVQETGPKDGPAAVFTHGMGAWSGFWMPLLEPVGKAGVRAIAVDLPPFGYSTRPADADYSRQAQARRLWAMLDSLGVQTASLVGHSIGGAPAMEAALSRPERLRSLVFLAPALGLDAAPPSKLIEWLLAPRWVRRAVAAAGLANPLLTLPGLRSFMARKEAATKELARIVRRPQSIKGTTAAYADWLPALLFPRRDALSLQPSAYSRLRVPTTLIWGDRDTVTPLAQGQALRPLIEGSRLVVLPGVGHMPQWEAREEVRELLIRRLAP